jgi:TatD DNase family protein
MRNLLSIDMHAHIDIAIEPLELTALNAIVFAACRSLDEAEEALARMDDLTVWGTGCHPGLVGAQRAFTKDRFEDQVLRTPYVAELGLDGKSRVPMNTQVRTLRTAFEVLTEHPRITSLHSYEATQELISVLGDYDLRGAVLHWWLGSPELTARAVELGCFFSVNSSSVRRSDVLRTIPLDRLLPETDHPFGDRGHGREQRPGLVVNVEAEIGKHHVISTETVRTLMWQNLLAVVRQASVVPLLPSRVRALLAAVPL